MLWSPGRGCLVLIVFWKQTVLGENETFDFYNALPSYCIAFRKCSLLDTHTHIITMCELWLWKISTALLLEKIKVILLFKKKNLPLQKVQWWYQMEIIIIIIVQQIKVLPWHHVQENMVFSWKMLKTWCCVQKTW